MSIEYYEQPTIHSHTPKKITIGGFNLQKVKVGAVTDFKNNDFIRSEYTVYIDEGEDSKKVENLSEVDIIKAVIYYGGYIGNNPEIKK